MVFKTLEMNKARLRNWKTLRLRNTAFPGIRHYLRLALCSVVVQFYPLLNNYFPFVLVDGIV